MRWETSGGRLACMTSTLRMGPQNSPSRSPCHAALSAGVVLVLLLGGALGGGTTSASSAIHGSITRAAHCGTAAAAQCRVGPEVNATGPPTWSNATAIVQNAPSTAAGPFRAAFDPALNATLLVTGADGPVGTWEFVNASFIELSPTLSPSTGLGGPLGFDGELGAPVLLSTAGSSPVVWQFTNGTWVVISTSGTGPEGRAAELGQWVDDPPDHAMLFFSPGLGSSPAYLWALDNATWENLTASAPPPEVASWGAWGAAKAPMVYDPSLGTDVLFGGPSESGASGPSGATWTFHAGTWTRVCAPCGPWGGGLTASS